MKKPAELWLLKGFNINGIKGHEISFTKPESEAGHFIEYNAYERLQNKLANIIQIAYELQEAKIAAEKRVATKESIKKALLSVRHLMSFAYIDEAIDAVCKELGL